MSLTELEPGKPYVGLLSETNETEENGAALLLSRELGVSVTVPYRADFPPVSKTVYSTGPSFDELAPKDTRTAVLHTREGSIWLFGTAKQRQTTNFGGSGVSERAFTAEDVVVGFREQGGPDAGLLVGVVESEMDGLIGWSGFSLFRVKPDISDGGKVNAVTYSSPPSESFSWKHDGITYKLANTWSATTSIRRAEATMKARVELRSDFDKPVQLSDHIREQRKLANLLTLMYGSPSRFRRHLVSDAGFASPRRWAISRHTYEDFLQPLPNDKKWSDPLATADELGEEGLHRWWALPGSWSRAFAPTISTLRRENPVVEDSLVNSCISLEGLGRLVGKADGEDATYNNSGRPTSTTQIYRCLKAVGFEWSNLAPSVTALAQAIGFTYNGVKHLEDKPYPDTLHMYAAARIAILTVRFIAAAKIVSEDAAGAQRSRADKLLVDADRALSTLAFAVNESGRFTTDPA